MLPSAIQSQGNPAHMSSAKNISTQVLREGKMNTPAKT
jgi:hypothetical protein